MAGRGGARLGLILAGFWMLWLAVPVEGQGLPGPHGAVPAWTTPVDSRSGGSSTDTIPPPVTEIGQIPGEDPGITPGGAFLRSLILPGWGHAATGSHFRGAFYVAAQSGTMWMLAKSMARRREAGRFRAAELDVARARLRASGVTRPDSIQILAERDPRVEDWDDLIESRSQQVEDWASLALFLVLLGATDAFVAGHLMDFPEPLSMEVAPAPGGGWSFSASLRPSVLLRLRP